MQTMSVNNPSLPLFDAGERKTEGQSRSIFLKLELGAVTTVLMGSLICSAFAVAEMVKTVLGAKLNVVVAVQKGFAVTVQNITIMLDDSEKEALRINQTVAIVGAVLVCISIGWLYLGAVRRAFE